MAILNPLNDLVAWVIMRLHSVLGALFGPDSGWAWGLSIVILVMLIRLCLVPLFVKQVNAQRKMAKHQPQLHGAAQEVQERQAASQRRDDEVLQGKRGQPAGGLPADDPADDRVLLAVQRAARSSPTGSRVPCPSTGLPNRWW